MGDRRWRFPSSTKIAAYCLGGAEGGGCLNFAASIANIRFSGSQQYVPERSRSVHVVMT